MRGVTSRWVRLWLFIHLRPRKTVTFISFVNNVAIDFCQFYLTYWGYCCHWIYKIKSGGHRARLREKENLFCYRKSLTFCTRTRPCARANDAKIERSRDVQCSTKICEDILSTWVLFRHATFGPHASKPLPVYAAFHRFRSGEKLGYASILRPSLLEGLYWFLGGHKARDSM